MLNGIKADTYFQIYFPKTIPIFPRVIFIYLRVITFLERLPEYLGLNAAAKKYRLPKVLVNVVSYVASCLKIVALLINSIGRDEI